MAGLEGLASIIYHEKQQSGSMLCAQHALNSLLRSLVHPDNHAIGLIDIFFLKFAEGPYVCMVFRISVFLSNCAPVAFKYTAPDLSEIARNLDVLEAQYNTDSEQGESKNMDDTGTYTAWNCSRLS